MNMDELILHMTEEQRTIFVKNLSHKRKVFKSHLKELILSYLKKQLEREKIPKAFQEHHRITMEREKQKKAQLEAVKKKFESVTDSSGNVLVNAAGLVGGAALSGANMLQERKMAIKQIQEAEDELAAAQMNIYIPGQRSQVADKVASVLSYRFQLLILRLNNGTSGYIQLAEFMGSCIETYAIEKLRGNENQVDALVKAALPNSSYHYYNALPNPLKKGLKKSLEIDPNINTLLTTCGPVVTAVLGKVKKGQYYSIEHALNHPIILDSQGNLYTGRPANASELIILNSQNHYPLILLGPNETFENIGLQLGTRPIDYQIRVEQLRGLLRFLPEYLIDDVSHDISDTTEIFANDPTYVVHVEERNEYPWGIERANLWKERQATVKKATKGLKPSIPGSSEVSPHGIKARNEANSFDAKQAKIDVEAVLCETSLLFEEIKKFEELGEIGTKVGKIDLKYKLTKKVYYLTLSVNSLIEYCHNLSKDKEAKQSYYHLAINALNTAKHIMEATRETPIIEFEKKGVQEKIIKEKKSLFKKWLEHLYFCNSALEITTDAAESMQLPQSIHAFIYRREAKNQIMIKDLMIQANTQVAHSNLLIQQMQSARKISSFNESNCTFDQSIIEETTTHNKHKLLKITQQKSTKYLGEDINNLSEEEPSSPQSSSVMTKQHCHIPSIGNGETKEEEEKVDEHEKDANLLQPGLMTDIEHNEAKENTFEHVDDPIILSSTQKLRPSFSAMDSIGRLIKSGPSASSISSNPSPASENKSDDIVSKYFKEILHDFRFSRKDFIDNQLKKIRLCSEAIIHFKNSIFTSIGIDEIKVDVPYKKNKRVELKQLDLDIATYAERISIEAIEDEGRAIGQERKARKRNFFSRNRRKARKAIKEHERNSIDYVVEIFNTQERLYQNYEKAHENFSQFSTIKVLWTLQRFENSILSKIPTLTDSNEELIEKIKTMNKIAKYYENKLDTESLRIMKAAYDKMLGQFKTLGNKVSNINEAIQYSQFVKNCNRKIIHAANGERSATASYDQLGGYLNGDIENIEANINNIVKSLINLKRDCQTQSDHSHQSKSTHIILPIEQAIEQISALAQNISTPSPKKPINNSQLTILASSLEDVQQKTAEKIHVLASKATKGSEKNKKELLILIQSDLQRATIRLKQTCPYLNWGVWVLTIAAKSCIAYHQNNIIPTSLDETECQDTTLTKEETKIDNLLLGTKKLLLELYLKLDYAMENPNEEINATLESNEELIEDEIQWAGRLTIDELQKRDELRHKNTMNLPPATTIYTSSESKISIPSVQVYQALLKTKPPRINPQKYIYQQLLTYCTIFIQTRLNLVHKLQQFREQLRTDYQWFDYNNLNRPRSQVIKEKILKLFNKINEKLLYEEVHKETLSNLERNLKSRRVITRIYFQSWKDKTRDTYNKNTLLSVLKEASKQKAQVKEMLRLQTNEEIEAQNHDNEGQTSESPMTKTVASKSIKEQDNIDYLSYKAIDTTFEQLQGVIDDYKKYGESESIYATDSEDEEFQDDDTINTLLSAADKNTKTKSMLDELPRENLEKEQRKQRYLQSKSSSIELCTPRKSLRSSSSNKPSLSSNSNSFYHAPSSRLVANASQKSARQLRKTPNSPSTKF